MTRPHENSEGQAALTSVEIAALAQRCADAVVKASRAAWAELHGYADDTTAVVVPIFSEL
jgi:glycyl-tRNA synthetase (class II)|tara:strand:+ start:1123 stop:1302 length:180 start_codon:yes stop_codon:yes gene_type:complete